MLGYPRPLIPTEREKERTIKMRKRNREILLWLSDKEFKKLEKDRNKAGMSRQDYIIYLVNNTPLIKCPKPDIERYRKIFDEDGRQVNDLAHRFNATDQLDINEYVALMNTLYKHMTQFEEEIKEEIRRLNDEEERTGRGA